MPITTTVPIALRARTPEQHWTESYLHHARYPRLTGHLMTVLPPGSRVLDPFMGSGTTLVAARDLGHVAHGIDLSPDNVRIAADLLGVPVP